MLDEILDMIRYPLYPYFDSKNSFLANLQRNRSHEASSPVVTKELVDFINELKRNNEELRQSNQILNQKLDQTLDIIREGFKSIQNALTSSVTNSNVMERRIHKDESDQAKDDSESSSVISGVDYISESSVPEDYVMCHPERTLSGLNNNSPQVPPSDQSDSTSDIVVLSNTMKERFGFEYDPKLDMNFWLRP